MTNSSDGGCRASISQPGLPGRIANIESVTMKAVKNPIPLVIAPEFSVNSLGELRDCLQRVDSIAQESDGASTSMASIARKLNAIAANTIAHCKALDASASAHRNNQRDIEYAQRKSRAVRLILEGSTREAVADRLGVSVSTVSSYAKWIDQMISIRLRKLARANDQTKALDIPVNLPLLDRLDLELSRRLQGQPWKDVWRGAIAESQE